MILLQQTCRILCSFYSVKKAMNKELFIAEGDWQGEVGLSSEEVDPLSLAQVDSPPVKTEERVENQGRPTPAGHPNKISSP